MSLSSSETLRDDETESLIQPSPNQHRRRIQNEAFSRKQHWKNLIVLSLTFLFCFTAYMAIQNIQSSINSSKGLGLVSLGIVYGSVIFSCLIAPIVINFFGVKWTIVVTTVSYCVYSYVNLFPSLATLIPASCLLGFSAAPLWVAQGTYLTTSAIQLAALIKEVPEYVISRFNGVLLAFFQTTQIWGNMLSFFLLDIGSNEEKPKNITSCGSKSCGAPIESDTTPPDAETINLLFGIFSIIGMIAVVLALCFLDPLPSTSARLGTDPGSTCSLITSTMKLMTNFQLFLLIPLFMYSGIEQAFMVGDFTKSFVTCTQGVSVVGLVMIAYGVSDAISSLLSGQLEKLTGRIFLFSFGGLLHLSLMVFLYLLDPSSIQPLYLYLVAVGWGVGDAIFLTQCASIIGVIFAGCQEPAFSNYRLWQSAGFCVSFVTSIPEAVCIWHKIIGISSFLVISLVLYYVCEYKIRGVTRQVSLEET